MSTQANFDSVLVGLGEVFQHLADEHRRLDELPYDEAQAAQVEIKMEDLQDRMIDIAASMASSQATTPKGAAVQIRALSYLSELPGESRQQQRRRLILSIAGVLEQIADIGRDDLGGQFTLGTNLEAAA